MTPNEMLDISLRIQKILHGLGPDIQSAILGDLVSLWLAGHVFVEEINNPPDQRPLTAALRDEMLTNWTAYVRALIPASERQILDTKGRA